jgi:hypothetical protein
VLAEPSTTVRVLVPPGQILRGGWRYGEGSGLTTTSVERVSAQPAADWTVTWRMAWTPATPAV